MEAHNTLDIDWCVSKDVPFVTNNQGLSSCHFKGFRFAFRSQSYGVLTGSCEVTVV